jgi:hypothetical protein
LVTITLDTSTLRLVDALAALDGLPIDVATTTVTAREVEGTAWASKAAQLRVIPEVMVLGRSPLGVAVLGSDADKFYYEGLLALLSGGGFPKPGKRDALTDGNKHLQHDAMILAAHAREGRDIFVSNDTKAIGRAGEPLREQLYQQFGIRGMTLAEFTAYCTALGAVD